MQKQIGVWIDHRKAVITSLSDGTETTHEVLSHLAKRVRFSFNSRFKTPDKRQQTVSEDGRDRQYDNQLDVFYTHVAALIKDAEAIWIIGPGEAKIEFEKFLQTHNLAKSITRVEPADKMTNRQIASKVREYFQSNQG